MSWNNFGKSVNHISTISGVGVRLKVGDKYWEEWRGGVWEGLSPSQLGVWGLAPRNKNQFCAKNYAILSKFWYFCNCTLPAHQRKCGGIIPSPKSGGPISLSPCSDAYVDNSNSWFSANASLPLSLRLQTFQVIPLMSLSPFGVFKRGAEALCSLRSKVIAYGIDCAFFTDVTDLISRLLLGSQRPSVHLLAEFQLTQTHHVLIRLGITAEWTPGSSRRVARLSARATQTRNSADADKPTRRDVRYINRINRIALHLLQYRKANSMSWPWIRVREGHWKCHHLIERIRLPIDVL